MSDSKTTSKRLTIVRELDGYKGKACLVHDEPTGDHFVVSTIEYDTMMLGMYASMGLCATGETLVFHADAGGDIVDWGEVGGGKGMSREEAIEQLAEALESDDVRGAGKSWNEE